FFSVSVVGIVFPKFKEPFWLRSGVLSTRSRMEIGVRFQLIGAGDSYPPRPAASTSPGAQIASRAGDDG
ncbi:MAG: hypothetical protein NTY26_09770, partial [Burkholderiales bacterium]|nr:hypothetical protein [Burkholderiales bacterium]